MRVALIDTNPRMKFYPLPLLKIGAWRKQKGDDCRLFYNSLPEKGLFDEIWLTTTFTFDVPWSKAITREAVKRAKKTRVGGVAASLLPKEFEAVGAEVHRGLLAEAEKFPPDYSFLPGPPEYSITHTSRGCVRKCGFCMVSRLEPDYQNRENWERDIHPESEKILFYDNNWTAKKYEDQKKDIEKIKTVLRSTRVKSFDFNQALDARLMTEKIADLFVRMPLDPVRFAFDGMHEDGVYQKAVEMMAARGFGKFVIYVLYNFTDTPEDLYYRLREGVRLSEKFRIRVASFPMRYQPILECDATRDYVGQCWTRRKKKNFMAIMGKAGAKVPGVVVFEDMEGFEFWFGKDAGEFTRMLDYPNLRALINKRAGNEKWGKRTFKAG